MYIVATFQYRDMHILVYCALQLYIRQFGDLGDSVIANRRSTVASGDFGDHVGNPCEYIYLFVNQ